MSSSITGTFNNRRDAEMTVERLVQEFGVERTDIFVAAEGNENTVGVQVAGSDAASGAPSEERRNDGAHHGGVTVSVDINDDTLMGAITGAIDEFNGSINTNEV